MRDTKHIDQLPILYMLPGMERVRVQRGLVYKSIAGEDLTLDVYVPPDLPSGSRRGAVLLVHGGSQPEHVARIMSSKPYTSWCRLLAASGLIAVLFKHRTDESYTRLPEAASDVDDLLTYVRRYSAVLQINPEALALWTASSGPLPGLRTALREAPSSIRGIVVYYGLMSLLNRAYFTYSEEELPLLQDYSPTYHLSRQDPSRIAPLFIARAGRDRVFLNDSLDTFINVALQRNIPLTMYNHPRGEHGFDVLTDDARTRAIIRATLAFLHECLA
jgi:acetyl esterase/lipase